ncbi:MAG: hypothetical protein LBB82_08450 [Treponema sp.]|jgi:hypothetical protein|nr:hypothetical protein [Treponema sp.]
MKRIIAVCMFFCLALPLFTQGTSAAPGVQDIAQDPAMLVGATLSDLVARFGVPKQVKAVRGIAEWQDDVVFIYESGEYYVYLDRVWQIRVKTAYGVKEGDPRAAVNRVLGEGRDFEGYSLYQRPSRVWPIMVRINWTSSNRSEGIYIFRSDF